MDLFKLLMCKIMIATVYFIAVIILYVWWHLF